MKIGSLKLRTRLALTISGIAAVPLLAAAVFAISAYRASVYEQAARTVETNMTVAHNTMSDALLHQREDAARVADDPRVARATGAALSAELRDLAGKLDATFILLLAPDGRVLGGSGGTARASSWPLAAEFARASGTTSTIAIVPQAEIARLGLVGSLALAARETPAGTIVPGEEEGALGIVSAAPLGDGRTALVFHALKLDNAVPESVVAKVGGNATIFQRGVRIATTVVDDKGKRAIGTVISDPVRAAVLDRGGAYRGEAVVVGQDNLTGYDPLRDPAGEIVGMLFVGVPKAPYAASVTRFAITLTVFIAAAIAAAVAAAFVISRGMTHPLEDIIAAAGSAAGGDLTVEVPVKGYAEARSVGTALNAMISGLRQLIGHTAGSGRSLAAVSGDITASARSASDSASRQASSVAEITATVSQLSRTFAMVADSAQRVLAVAEDALESAQSGRDAVERSDRTMDELAEGATQVSEAAQAMSDVANDITEMTSIIGGIAEQTKILALNAAIEAARAGEAGRGFGVVATEIRGLAESVQHSAGRIKALVAGIQEASANLRRTADRQTGLAETGVESSKTSRDTFDSIVSQMDGTATAAREIATAAVEQKTAAEQLAVVMRDVTSSADETARVSKDLVASADAIRNEADELTQGLGGFRI